MTFQSTPSNQGPRNGSYPWLLSQLEVGEHLWVEIGKDKSYTQTASKNAIPSRLLDREDFAGKEFTRILYMAVSLKEEGITYMAKVIRIK